MAPGIVELHRSSRCALGLAPIPHSQCRWSHATHVSCYSTYHHWQCPAPTGSSPTLRKTVMNEQVCRCVPAGPPTGTLYCMRGNCAAVVLPHMHMSAPGGHRRYELMAHGATPRAPEASTWGRRHCQGCTKCRKRTCVLVLPHAVLLAHSQLRRRCRGW